MMKIFSIRFWIILISCCIVTSIVWACAGDWGPEYGVSNFSPEIFVDSAYSPFFYSNQYYYGIGHEESQDVRFNSSNVDEWMNYASNQVPRTELEYLLEKASAASVDSAVSFALGKQTAVPATMQGFAVLKQKNNATLAGFFSYLQLAKKTEVFALNNISNSWEYETKASKIPVNATSINQQLLDAYNKTNDAFLKERYWFQLVRSYFFTTTAREAINFFTVNEKNMPHNKLYYRTMGYAAGAYYQLKNFSKANYLYSKIYEHCDEMKTAAHYSFHPQEEADWNATLALCQNNEEKITLWQMLGIFYGDESRSITKIYQLNPASDKLDLLLARAVNIYEQKFTAGNAYNDVIMKPGDSAAMAGLPALINRIANTPGTGKPWVWQMAAGYLKTLDGKYAAAEEWYSKTAKSIPASKLAMAQLRLLKMINTIAEAKKIDSRLEERLLPDISWLKNFDAAAMPQLRYTDAYEWLKIKMAAKYRQQHNLVKSECFTSNNNFYASTSNVEMMKAFLSNNHKTPYEKLCADLAVKKIPDLFEYQAIRLVYADSLDQAIEKMKMAGENAAVILPGNPFNGRIMDCHDCDHAAPQKIKYSKLDFLQKLRELKSKINAGEDLYTNAILLANAHYNISQFGNARAFYEGKVVGEGYSDPGYIDSIFRKMLTGTALATKYYRTALKIATTNEQRARCQYMLAKCQRNQWYNDKIYNNKEGDSEKGEIDFIAFAGFKALKQYANTQYYKDVIGECGYFKTYVEHGK